MEERIRSLTILGGRGKGGAPESAVLELCPGEILCIVGPTGSGKSRLLEDIECLAQGDTPTQRRVLLNGRPVTAEQRYAFKNRLVAQLSQNMNFVMDLTVREFILMHAESREIENPLPMLETILCHANRLAGEPFSEDVSVTQLSGGQSRALMIADTALLSPSPVVLIDEIENAGVDRRKALDLLVREDKIVLISTHDPILALLGDKRISIKNGAIYRTLITSEAERSNLKFMQELDCKMLELRERLRRGDALDFSVENFFARAEGAGIPVFAFSGKETK